MRCISEQLSLEESAVIIYSFCEPATATSISKWHIRKLSHVGHKYGGGADTPSLCGRQVSWDVEVEFRGDYFDDCCRKCVAEFKSSVR